MSARLRSLWERLRTSFWFVPSLLTAAAAALATLLAALDRLFGAETLTGLWWIYGGGPEGARALLSAVAGSVITVAGTTFSITIAALTLASSQFGPRLLRNFVRDLGNQIVLGTLIATFLYCLLVLRTVRGQEDSTFVPHIAVTGAVALSLACIGALIYFIHHIATAIQVDHVIARVAGELDVVIDRLYPANLGRGPVPPEELAQPAPITRLQTEGVPVRAPKAGYLQAVDADALLGTAAERDLLVQVLPTPGDWVTAGDVLMYVWPAGQLDQAICEGLQGSFILGAQRTDQQDVRFALNQLVEIAVRALSPGTNDPFTALACIDHLGAGLRRLAAREWPAPERADAAGHTRIITEATPFATILDATAGPIHYYGATHPLVLCRLLDALVGVAAEATTPERQAAALRQIEQIAERGARLPDEIGRAQVIAHTRQALRQTTTQIGDI